MGFNHCPLLHLTSGFTQCMLKLCLYKHHTDRERDREEDERGLGQGEKTPKDRNGGDKESREEEKRKKMLQKKKS